MDETTSNYGIGVGQSYDPHRTIRQQLVTQLIGYYGAEHVDELVAAAKRLQDYITTGE